MPAVSPYPAERFHPNGHKTITVFSPEDDEAAQKLFQQWREGEREAALAAREGRPVTAPAPPAPSPSAQSPTRAMRSNNKILDQET